MRGRAWALAVGLGLLVGTGAGGQVPGPGAGRAPAPFAGAMRAPGVQFLLANTGPLHLTDQQVSRLAAIARRVDARRQALRDSMRTRLAPATRPDSAGRAAMRARALQTFQQLREQEHSDLRDALAVLTPDQLASAWEMVARRPAGAGRAAGLRRGAAFRGFGPGRPGRPGRAGRPGRPGRPGMAPGNPVGPNGGALPPA